MKSTRRRLRRICMIRLECTAVSPRLWLLKRTSRLKRPRKMRTTYRRTRHKLRFWPNDCRLRQSFVFCLFIPFPQKYKSLDFENALSRAIMLTLLLVCSFSSRVHSIPRVLRLEVFRNDKSALHGSEQRALSRRRNMRCTWKYNSPKAQKKSPIARWFFFC